MEIKNIIFDLGGVILNIDYNLTIAAFKHLGISNFDEIYSQASQNHLFDSYESGKIDSLFFLNELSNYLGNNYSHTQITDAWNAMLLDLPSERLHFLQELKKEYNTALLSNTNPIHIQKFHEIIQKDNDIDSLDSFFHHVHFSSDLGMRKPDKEIFTAVCRLHGYLPNETLFIDDSIQHVEGAKSAGLYAYYLDTSNNDVIQLVRSLLT
jgi:putative hydrolase of the HAD superfamily